MSRFFFWFIIIFKYLYFVSYLNLTSMIKHIKKKFLYDRLIIYRLIDRHFDWFFYPLNYVHPRMNVMRLFIIIINESWLLFCVAKNPFPLLLTSTIEHYSWKLLTFSTLFSYTFVSLFKYLPFWRGIFGICLIYWIISSQQKLCWWRKKMKKLKNESDFRQPRKCIYLKKQNLFLVEIFINNIC